jgi:G3E family GTPase
MSTEIFIVSGFLGAGKTTLIRKLVEEVLRDEKTAIVENDFGDVSVDAALLGASGLVVEEINSGCICCAMTGDFIDSLKGLLERFKPDKVIIEPSGVAKLSEIESACSDGKIARLARVCGKITVVDASRLKKYIDNFGEFFEDQIRHADVVMLSRVEDCAGELDDALGLIKELNKDARIFAKQWSRINAREILLSLPGGEAVSGVCEHCGDSGGGGHDHSAEDVFAAVTLYPEQMFSEEDLKARLSDAEKLRCGTVLRAKGIVRGESGYLNLQYVQGNLKIEASPVAGSMICFIGSDLDRSELAGIFR